MLAQYWTNLVTGVTEELYSPLNLSDSFIFKSHPLVAYSIHLFNYSYFHFNITVIIIVAAAIVIVIAIAIIAQLPLPHYLFTITFIIVILIRFIMVFPKCIAVMSHLFS